MSAPAAPQPLPEVGNPYGQGLTADDYRSLAGRWIDRDSADAALLFRVNNFEGREQVGEKRRNCAGILIPYLWPGSAHWHGVRIRRDNHEWSNGKPDAKYMGENGRSTRLYVVPGTSLEALADTALPLIVAEG